MPVARRRPVVADLTLVTGGAMTANVAGYLLQLLAGRWLGVTGYSEFASLLAVQLLCAVPALALQNVVARELVRGAGLAAVRKLGLRCAGIVAVVAALLVPAVAAMLHAGVAASAAALGAAPALVLLSGEQGALQGHRRFRALAVVLGTAGVARVFPALIVLAVGGGAAGALWAAAAGIATAALIARYVAGTDTSADGEPERTGGRRRGNGSDLADESSKPGAPDHVSARPAPGRAAVGVLPVLRAAQVQAALMALSSVDLIVARIVLDDVAASRYALGAIAAKIAFWLPQAVGVVLYPRMAQPQHSARAVRSAVAVLVGIGIAAVLAAAIAAPLAPLLAGRAYAPVQGLLWLFALHGAILAVLQGVLLSAIAVDRTALAAITWIGLAAEVIAMLLFARSVPSLITTATGFAAVTTAVVAVGVLAAARRGESLRATGTARP